MAGIFDFTARLVLLNFQAWLELKAGFLIPTVHFITSFAAAVYGSTMAVIFIDLSI
jgi:hypothetical protein